MTRICVMAVSFVVTEILWSTALTTAEQALNRNKRAFSPFIETNVVPKECFERKEYTKIRAYYTAQTCYKRRSTKTGILFWKKTRYYQIRTYCTKLRYRTEYDFKKIPVCCDGYREFEGNCAKEMTSPPNITCVCSDNEETVFSSENGTCECKEKERVCTDDEVDSMEKVAANCSIECNFQMSDWNCTAQCNCTRDEIIVTAVGSQSRPEHDHTSSSGILTGAIILFVVAILVIVAIVVIVKKRIIGRNFKRRTISNLSYGMIDVHDNVIPSSVHDADHYASADLDASGTGDDGDVPTCLTHCKSLSVPNQHKENDYVLVGIENSKMVSCSDKVKTESPYDYPTQRDDLKTSDAENNAKSDGPYDFPKSNGQLSAVAQAGNVYDVVRFQKTSDDDPKDESSYDTPRSQRKKEDTYSLVKTNRNHVITDSAKPGDRAYIAMSVSSKGSVAFQEDDGPEDDLYVLPSEANNETSEDESGVFHNKLRHNYSNVAVGPYENV